MRFERALALAAALTLGAPADAAPGRILWVELCDASHPGRRVPLPLDPDRHGSQPCHASCGLVPERRIVSGRKRPRSP